jgi:YidC/Oxa1 family membrane protein insertase
MKTLWISLIYKPLYNILVFLVDYVYDHSMFISVIILTLFVRFIIYPLSYKSIKTQIQTKKIQPELNKIKKEITDKQEQARATMELYKKHDVNPFSGFLVMLIQLPIILALYWVLKDISDGLDTSLLYSFISEPKNINLTTFGFDLTKKSIILALLTGISQYIFLKKSTAMRQTKEDSHNKSEQEKMMAMVGQSMKYSMPIMITFFSYVVGGAVALYWFVSNVFMIFQEVSIQKKLEKEGIKK